MILLPLAIRLARLADMIEGFPGNAVAFVKSLPVTVARRVRKLGHAVCGCHHRTAKGCALYVKDGPRECACECHLHDSLQRDAVKTRDAMARLSFQNNRMMS